MLEECGLPARLTSIAWYQTLYWFGRKFAFDLVNHCSVSNSIVRQMNEEAPLLVNIFIVRVQKSFLRFIVQEEAYCLRASCRAAMQAAVVL